MLKSILAGLSKRRRLRLKAGALALSFAFLTLLPWIHVMTLGAHDGHGCCHHDQASDEPLASDALAIAADVAGNSEACWVCDSLASLLHTNVLTDAQALVRPSLSSAYVARAPHAPVLKQIYPASRSQAPPARA